MKAGRGKRVTRRLLKCPSNAREGRYSIGSRMISDPVVGGRTCRDA